MLPNSRSTESQDKEVAIRLLSQKLQVELNRLFHELRDGIDMEFIAQRKIQVIFFFLIGVWGLAVSALLLCDLYIMLTKTYD